MFSRIFKAIKKKFFKKKKVRQYIEVKQEKNIIYINGLLRYERYKVKQLQFISRFTDKEYQIGCESNSNQFEFKINVNDHPELIGGEEIYDLYLLVQVSKENFSDKKALKLEETAKSVFDENGNQFYEYPIRLGRFEQTKLDNLRPFIIEGNKYYLYNTVKGNLSLSVNYEIQPQTTVQIDDLKSKRHHIKFDGKLFTKSYQIQKIDLIVVGRETNVEDKLPVDLSLLKKKVESRFGLHRYKYETRIGLNELFKSSFFQADIYDLFFDIKYAGFEEIIRVRIGKPRFWARNNLKESNAWRDNTVFSVSPYYTFKLRNLSLQVDDFDEESYQYMKKLLRWAWIRRAFNKRKDIWIVGELSYKAQDTGYHFFKYMRENHPEKNVYYVVHKNSPEAGNVLPYGNVLYFRSKEHIRKVLLATRVIGSHHPDYLYPLRTTEFNKKVKAKRVFLQHGVMGTKNMVANYGKDAPGFRTDLFMVSSDFEKEMIVNDFGYEQEDVFVTGLSRFDNLLKKDQPQKRMLLIIPTWRDWLIREDIFLDSEYLERYTALVYSRALQNLAKKFKFEVVLCLHPNMQKYTSHFENAPVTIINQGEFDVQSLLKESAMMITDYSSVAFDFSFLDKPIIYYQFDRKKFIGKKGSHLDLDNDLPGDIVYELDDIITLTEEYAKSNFTMQEEYKQRTSKFLKYKDQNASERIYQAVTTRVRRPLHKSIMGTEIYRTLFKRFRKSKRYFPTMRLFYNIVRRIAPVDEKLMLFESGVGKQYADSPKVIYEEVIRRNLDYKKVWVCNKSIRFSDPNTKRIKRLSPSYYYYLAKSKVWVNNQNFPTYIKKRPQTTYIQTWHGTPLKKMLYDIENIMGRSDDYLDRVSAATKAWDYLVSPSTYATNAFKSAFKYQGEIVETGYPRNDVFYKEDRFNQAVKVRNRLNIARDKKVILYAPTFRDNQTSKKNKFQFEIPMDLYEIKDSLGDDYIILLRMHVVISNKVKIDEELQDFVMNVSNYSDIQELLLITDILVTDYSSVMFDYANTKRPLLFYTYDLEEYRDDIRGFYMDFENEAPGPLIRTTDELVESINRINEVEIKYKDKYNAFYSKYCSLEDGRAGERIVDLIEHV